MRVWFWFPVTGLTDQVQGLYQFVVRFYSYVCSFQSEQCVRANPIFIWRSDRTGQETYMAHVPVPRPSSYSVGRYKSRY